MRSPTKQDSSDLVGRRTSEHRRSETVSGTRAARPKGQSRITTPPAPAEKGAVVTSMVDALEDILKWERASERAMRVASEQSTTELDPSN